PPRRGRSYAPRKPIESSPVHARSHRLRQSAPAILSLVYDAQKCSRFPCPAAKREIAIVDRIGKLAKRNNDITDTDAKLAAYAQSGLLAFSGESAIPQLQPPKSDAGE